MSDLRLAYDDPDTTEQMSVDCLACGLTLPTLAPYADLVQRTGWPAGSTYDEVRQRDRAGVGSGVDSGAGAGSGTGARAGISVGSAAALLAARLFTS